MENKANASTKISPIEEHQCGLNDLDKQRKLELNQNTGESIPYADFGASLISDCKFVILQRKKSTISTTNSPRISIFFHFDISPTQQ